MDLIDDCLVLFVIKENLKKEKGKHLHTTILLEFQRDPVEFLNFESFFQSLYSGKHFCRKICILVSVYSGVLVGLL